MDKRKLRCIIMNGIAVLIFCILFIVLPEKLVVQVGLNGKASNVQPKLIGLMVPFLISSAGALIYGFADEGKKIKSLILYFAGIAAFIITFVMNHK